MPKMTDAQKEAAARELCRLTGVHPDSMVGHSPDPSSDGFVADVYLYSPAWRRMVREIEYQEKLELAMQVGRNYIENQNK